MLSVEIYCVGTLKEQYLRDAVAEYAKRLSAYCKFGVREMKNEQLVPALYSSRAFKAALCVEGAQRSSEEFAALLEELPSRGISAVIFGCIVFPVGFAVSWNTYNSRFGTDDIFCGSMGIKTKAKGLCA